MSFWLKHGPAAPRQTPSREPLSAFRHLALLETQLPAHVQDLAIEKYELFKQDPHHPSLGFQAKGSVWTVDIGRSYRAIAFRKENHLWWFWIGSHEDDNNVLNRMK